MLSIGCPRGEAKEQRRGGQSCFPGICEADRMNREITWSRVVGRAGQMVANKAGWEAGEGTDSQRAASDQGQEK